MKSYKYCGFLIVFLLLLFQYVSAQLPDFKKMTVQEIQEWQKKFVKEKTNGRANLNILAPNSPPFEGGFTTVSFEYHEDYTFSSPLRTEHAVSHYFGSGDSAPVKYVGSRMMVYTASALNYREGEAIDNNLVGTMTFVNSQTEKDANCTTTGRPIGRFMFSFDYDSTTKMALIGGETQYIGVMPPCYAGIRETTEVEGKIKFDAGNDSRLWKVPQGVIDEAQKEALGFFDMDKVGSKYKITYNYTYHKGFVTKIMSLTATISFKQSTWEAFIVPSVAVDDYHKWLPQGPDPKDEKTTGNNISFTVYTRDKKKPDVKITANIKSVIYSLTNVSHEPGYAMNYPSDKPNTKADLQLLKTNEKPDPETEKLNLTLDSSEGRDVNVACFDYGAYSRITALVTLTDGTVLIAKEDKGQKNYATIPYCTHDDSKVADYWKELHKATGLKDDDDDDSEDKLEKNPYKGDGFSLYEEYRGFIENKVHIRTDPHKKDVMICDKVRDALVSAAVDLPSGSALEKAQKAALPNRSQDGINMFAAVTGFITHNKFKEDEFGVDIGKNIYAGVKALDTINLPPFTHDKVLNFNTSGYAHLHEQSGLLLLPSPRSLGYAAAFGKNKNDVRPLKDWYCLVITADFSARMEGYSSVTGDIINDTGIAVAVNPNGHAKIITDLYAVTVAHEMLHYCSVKHHGDVGESIDNTDFKTFPSAPDKIYMGGIFDAVPVKLFWDDLAVTQITSQDPLFKNTDHGISVRIKNQNGTCSGVEDCIMRYDDGQAYKGDDGNYYLLLDWKHYSELTGITLCKSKTGTGVNARGHKPRSRYGDATNGNCQAQVCVNDKYHQ